MTIPRPPWWLRANATAFEEREALGEIGSCFGGCPPSEIAIFQ
jgi:hypothetical protein